MKKLFLALMLIVSTSIVGFSQVSNPVSWEKAITNLGNGEYELAFTATIEEGWYIYDIKPNDMILPTQFVYEYESGTGELVGAMTASKEATKSESYSYWKNSVTLKQKVKVSDGTSTINVTAEWMSCNEGTCTPPQDELFSFQIGEKVASASNVTAVAVKDAVVSEEKKESSSLWSIILAAIAAGFLALVTPCVFPMVPMTVSFFLKGSGSKAKGRLMAIIFGISIVILYTLPIAIMIGLTYILGGDSVTSDVFNWLATHWLPNTLFFIIFMIFAVSFFGAFEIVLPSWIVNKSDEQSDKGGLLGVFFMALTLVLVSFSCTGPIVGTIIVQSTQGAIWEPIVSMLAFSIAFAIPFTLFAFFPTMLKNLPKSGGWLNSVKVVLGFIEVALALKFLSMVDQGYSLGLLDREVYIAMWIVIFTLLGFYLLGKIKFAHDSDEPYLKVKKLFMAMIVFSFVIYMIPGMWGAPLKALAGYLPPIQTIDFNLPKMISDVKGSGGSHSTTSNNNFPSKVLFDDNSFFVHPEGLHGFYDYEEGVAYAKKVGKPVFLDFTGKQCVNCREMEQIVLSDPRVKDLINNSFVLITLYVDSKLELPEDRWVTNEKNGRVLKTVGRINANYQINKFKSNAQPYYVAIDAADGAQVGGHISYDKDVEKYLKFLNDSLEAYNNKHKK